MKFLFILDDVDNTCSGIVSSTLSLANELAMNGYEITIATGAARFERRIVCKNLNIVAFRCLNFFGLRVWFGFLPWFWMHRLRFQYISIESMWLPVNFIVFIIKFLFNLNFKIIITPHGMLTKSSLAKSHKKKILMLYAYKFFYKQITLIRTVSKHEVEIMIEHFPSLPAFLIPNAQPKLLTDIDVFGDRPYMFVYLGRLDPIKRLEILVDAYTEEIANVHGPLHIYGPHADNVKYVKMLKNRSEFVKFVGPIFGDEKIGILKNTNLLVLASLDEGMPMILLEAMQCGCNILITQKLYSELFYVTENYKFIHTFDGSVLDLQRKLHTLSRKKYFYRNTAIDFVNKNFSTNKIARELMAFVDAS